MSLATKFERCLAAVAKRLGLQHEGSAVLGRLNDHDVQLYAEPVGDRQDALAPVVVCRVEPPLDLGVFVHLRSSWRIRFRPDPSSAEFTLGDEDIDARYMLHADDPERASCLLAPEVRAELARCAASAQLVAVRDGEVALGSFAPVSASFLERLVVQGEKLASAVDASRGRVPAATMLAQHVPAWRAYAAQHQLSFMEAPLAIWGQAGGHRAHLMVVRTGFNAYAMQVRAAFREPLHASLAVAEAKLRVIGFLTNQQDLEVGHAAFDRVFLVQAARPEAARAVLTPSVCDALVELHRRGLRPRVDDYGVALTREPPTSRPEEEFALLEEVAEIAALADGHRHQPGGSPYR